MATNKEKQRKTKKNEDLKKKKISQEKCFLIKFEDRFEDLEDR